MTNVDPYESFKRGISRDAAGAALNLAGGLTGFFLIVFLLIFFWCVVMEKSGWSPEARIFGTIFLSIIIPCLFFTRTSNFIFMIWSLILLLLLLTFVLIFCGYFIYIVLGNTFELI